MCEDFGTKLLNVSKRVDEIMKNRVSEISEDQAKATAVALNGIEDMAKDLIADGWSSECPTEAGEYEWKESFEESGRRLKVSLSHEQALQVSVPQAIGPNIMWRLDVFDYAYEGQWRPLRGGESETPDTDAAAYECDRGYEVVSAAVARALETRLADAESRLSEEFVRRRDVEGSLDVQKAVSTGLRDELTVWKALAGRLGKALEWAEHALQPGEFFTLSDQQQFNSIEGLIHELAEMERPGNGA